MSHLHYDGLPVADPGKTVRELEHRQERRFHRQGELLLESVRRQTFTNWTVVYVDPDKLAKAGFFYLRTQDHVQCVFCQGIVGYWDLGDEPVLEHRKHFPNCQFMTGVATGNVSMASTNDTDENRLYRMLDDYHAFKVAATRPGLPSTTYHTDAARVVEAGKMAFPQLNTTNSRLQTYTRWPQDVGIAPDQLAEAGFFSTGLADWVQCFHCGGGLFGWRKGDDPVVDHARFYPFCPFIRTKHEEGITVGNNYVPPVQIRQVELTNQEAELLLHHPLAKRLVTMGLSQVSVREALKLRLEAQGVLCRTVTEALELVFDYEENQRKKNLQTSCYDGPRPTTQIRSHESPSGTGMEGQTNQHFFQTNSLPDKHNQLTLPGNIKLQQEVEELRQQVAMEESRLLCRLCGKERVAVVFQPCSHLHLCADCARPRDTCATCGSIVRGTLRPIIG